MKIDEISSREDGVVLSGREIEVVGEEGVRLV